MKSNKENKPCRGEMFCMDVGVKIIDKAAYPLALQFYRSQGYAWTPSPEDTLIVAELDGELIGAVRLFEEHGFTNFLTHIFRPIMGRLDMKGSRLLRLRSSCRPVSLNIPSGIVG